MKRKVVDPEGSDKEKIKDIQNLIVAEENAADSPKKPRMAGSTEENQADSPKKPATNVDLAVDVLKAKDIQTVICSEVPTADSQKKPSDVDVKKNVKGHAEYAAK